MKRNPIFATLAIIFCIVAIFWLMDTGNKWHTGCTRKATIKVGNKTYTKLAQHQSIQHDTVVITKDSLIHTKPIIVHHWHETITPADPDTNAITAWCDTVKLKRLTLVINDTTRANKITGRSVRVIQLDTTFTTTIHDTLFLEQQLKRNGWFWFKFGVVTGYVGGVATMVVAK